MFGIITISDLIGIYVAGVATPFIALFIIAIWPRKEK